MHLTYCMNVHPGEQWDDVVRATREDAGRVRALCGSEEPFGLGLRISAAAAAELTAQPERLAAYRALLHEQSMYVFTVNAFPFGTFHGTRVKEDVYAPDWRDPARRDYTIQVAQILAQLLPPGVEGSISTAPLTFKAWPDSAAHRERALCHLAEVAYALWQLEGEQEHRIVLAMEPEPGCDPETIPELVSVMNELRDTGAAHLQTVHGLSRSSAEDLLRRHVGCCFDTAHQAVEFESLADGIRTLQQAGIVIGKVQVSAAIEADCSRPEAVAQLASMQDEVYLHQVGMQRPDGSVQRWNDLPAFLADLPALPPATARVHYHVPLFAETFGALRSTAPLVRAAAPVLLAASSHIEAETYTWQVWKEATGEPLPLHAGLVRELQWLRALTT